MQLRREYSQMIELNEDQFYMLMASGDMPTDRPCALCGAQFEDGETGIGML